MKRERLDPVKPLPPGKRPVELFMDSGVFPAWGRGQQIDIKAYCAFIKRNAAYLDCYASVDFIPGEFGKPVTREEVEFSAKLSYDNHQKMKGWGFTPIPIFHQGERFEWLERYLKDGEPYIGIATRKDLAGNVQREWLDHCFTMLTNADGIPFVKTHGFGITTISQLQRYPWWSSDSTTWALAAGFGLVYVPALSAKGELDFDAQPFRIIMSGRPQKAWSSAKRQYEGLNPAERAWVDMWLQHLGIDHFQARYDPICRRSACLKYFLGFAKNHHVIPFAENVRHGGGFFQSYQHKGKAKLGWERMVIYNSTHMANGQFSRIMTEADCKHRLISYWECMNKPDETLHRYVVQGTTDLFYKPRPPKIDWQDDRWLSHRRFKLLERIKANGQE
jgi:hypothetical protein